MHYFFDLKIGNATLRFVLHGPSDASQELIHEMVIGFFRTAKIPGMTLVEFEEVRRIVHTIDPEKEA